MQNAEMINETPGFVPVPIDDKIPGVDPWIM